MTYAGSEICCTGLAEMVNAVLRLMPRVACSGLLSPGSGDLGCAVQGGGLDTVWSQAQNRSCVTGSKSSGICNQVMASIEKTSWGG